MPKLGQSIAGLLKQYGLEDAIQLQKPVLFWEQAVGPIIAENCKAVEMRGKTLYLSAQSSAWRNEVAMQKESILKALNKIIGSQMVKEIRFK